LVSQSPIVFFPHITLLFYPHIQFYSLSSILPSRNIRQRVPSGAIQPQCGGIGGGWSRLGYNDSSVAGLYQAPRGPPTDGCPLHSQPGPGHSSGHDGTLGAGYAGLASAETAPAAAASTTGSAPAALAAPPGVPLPTLGAAASTLPTAPGTSSTATVGRRGVGWRLGRHGVHAYRKPDIPLARLQSREEHGAKFFQQRQLL